MLKNTNDLFQDIVLNTAAATAERTKQNKESLSW